jgi:geranylgeranyl diphosphate synthase type II
MVAGQLLDITLPPQELTEEKIHELILKKTGSLIVSAVKSGAILGKAAPSEIQAIEEYGKNVGLAFQVRDDLMDAAQQTASAFPPRPNYVLVVGRGEAQKRLQGFVADAVQALEKASLRSEELRELALRLLRLDKGD